MPVLCASADSTESIPLCFKVLEKKHELAILPSLGWACSSFRACVWIGDGDPWREKKVTRLRGSGSIAFQKNNPTCAKILGPLPKKIGLERGGEGLATGKPSFPWNCSIQTTWHLLYLHFLKNPDYKLWTKYRQNVTAERVLDGSQAAWFPPCLRLWTLDNVPSQNLSSFVTLVASLIVYDSSSLSPSFLLLLVVIHRLKPIGSNVCVS